MAGVELHGPQLVGIGAARPHEGQRPVDLPGQPLVALPGRAGPDEVLVPGVDLVQVGVAAGGEGAALVQRHGGAVVGAQQAVRVGRAGLGGEVEAVDRVAAVGGQLDVVADLGRPRPGLGELAGHPADLDDRHAGPVGQHDGHLQDGLELGPDVLGGRPGERLGAVAALEQERLAAGHGGQPVAELVALAGEDQRRQPGQLGGDGVQRGRVGPLRLLGGRPVPPALGVGAVAAAVMAARLPLAACWPGWTGWPGWPGGRLARLARRPGVVCAWVTVSRYAPRPARRAEPGLAAHGCPVGNSWGVAGRDIHGLGRAAARSEPCRPRSPRRLVRPAITGRCRLIARWRSPTEAVVSPGIPRQRISRTGFRDHGRPHCGPTAGRDTAAIRRTGPGWGIWTATLPGPPVGASTSTRRGAEPGADLASPWQPRQPRQLTRLTTDPPQSRLTRALSRPSLW